MRRREDLTAPRAARVASACSTTPTGSARSANRSPATSAPPSSSCGRRSSSRVWIVHNTFAPDQYQFDPWSRGLVLLTLVLSLQASYAAPLILLAQNRQEFRDRLTAESDRNVAERTQADTEFLAREIARVRLSLSDMVTGETLDERSRPTSTLRVIEQLSDQVDVADDHGAAAERATTSSTSSTVSDEN